MCYIQCTHCYSPQVVFWCFTYISYEASRPNSTRPRCHVDGSRVSFDKVKYLRLAALVRQQALRRVHFHSLVQTKNHFSFLTLRVVERSCSAVECRTRNQVSPGSNPPLLPFRRLGIFFLSVDAPVHSLPYEWVTVPDTGGHVSGLVSARNCSIAKMLPGEAELVSEWTGLPVNAKSVKRFERSNGPDIALYKNYLYL